MAKDRQLSFNKLSCAIPDGAKENFNNIAVRYSTALQ